MGDIRADRIGVANKPVGGGLEHPVFAKLNTTFMQKRHHTPTELATEYQVEMHQPWPCYIKDPRYVFTWPIWEAADIRPKHVWLCVRNPAHTDRSVAETTNWKLKQPWILYREFYALLTYLEEHDIPYTFVHYPRIGRDEVYANRILGTFIADPWATVQQVWEQNLCHYDTVDSSVTRSENRPS